MSIGIHAQEQHDNFSSFQQQDYGVVILSNMDWISY